MVKKKIRTLSFSPKVILLISFPFEIEDRRIPFAFICTSGIGGLLWKNYIASQSVLV